MENADCEVDPLSRQRTTVSENLFRKAWAFPTALAVILLLQAMLLLYAIFQQSVVSDEYGHFYAGLAYWRNGDVRLFHVNPPLVRGLATVIASRDRWPENKLTWSVPERPEFAEGRKLASTHRTQFLSGIRFGRMVVAMFALLGTLICGVWGRELAGDWAGLAAGPFWAFQPQMIAHGALITNDVPVAATMLLAAWCFSRWSQRRTYRWAFAVGATLAMAILCKFTALILLPILAGFSLAAAIQGHRRTVALHALLAISVMLLLIAAVYRFDSIGKPLGQFPFVSEVFVGDNTEKASPRNRISGTLLGQLPCPLPEQFLLGLDRQQLDFETGIPSYARGQRSQHGWWWFYLYSMLVKLPVGTLLAICVAIVYALRGHTAFTTQHLLPAIIALAIVEVTALKSGFAQQHRYIFPLYPFLFLLIVTPLAKDGHRRVAGRLVLAGLLFTGIGTAWGAPHWLGYFNSLSGGTNHSHYHLFNDATDWGQDTERVVQWIQDHPQCRPYHIYSTNSFGYGASLAEVPANLPADRSPKSTWYIVSKTDLVIHPELAERFLHRTPDDRIGSTHLIYRIDEDQE